MKKILIVSDTHKSHKNLEKVLEQNRDIDMMIHLGDVENAEDYIRVLAGCPTHFVAGNNDFFSDLPSEEDFFVEGYHIFITHGHYYYVGAGESRLKDEAISRGADIVMYGHTHRPSVTSEDGVMILNPGSISYPRQEGRRASYIMLEIDESGEMSAAIKYI